MSSASVQTASHTAEAEPAAAYAMPLVSEVSDEIERLDEMHAGFKDFFDSNLSYAPLDDFKPKKILELGTGSGAWANQAAHQFPNADVLAVDLAPVPSRPFFPPNLKFQVLDLTKPFPFEAESFDLIHSRSVFMHLPNQEEVVSRVIKLVKPGGWLLLEDPDFIMRDEKSELGPATKTWFEAYHGIMRTRGVEYSAPVFERVVKASGAFSEVNAKKVVIPISEQSDDHKRNRLGRTLKVSIHRGAVTFAEQKSPGFSHELAKELNVEFYDPSRHLAMDIIFTWSRKRL